MLTEAITKYGKGQPCIIYGRTKQSVEDIAEHLQGVAVRAEAYHAALSTAARSSVQARVMIHDCVYARVCRCVCVFVSFSCA